MNVRLIGLQRDKPGLNLNALGHLANFKRDILAAYNIHSDRQIPLGYRTKAGRGDRQVIGARGQVRERVTADFIRLLCELLRCAGVAYTYRCAGYDRATAAGMSASRRRC